MDEPYRVEPEFADYPMTIAPLVDQAFDAWDGDVAALLGVRVAAVQPERLDDEPAGF